MNRIFRFGVGASFQQRRGQREDRGRAFAARTRISTYLADLRVPRRVRISSMVRNAYTAIERVAVIVRRGGMGNSWNADLGDHGGRFPYAVHGWTTFVRIRS